MLEAGTSMYHPGSLDLSIVVARAGTTEELSALRGVSSNNGGYRKVARERTREYFGSSAARNKVAGLGGIDDEYEYPEVGAEGDIGLHVCRLSRTFRRRLAEFSSAPQRSSGFDAVTEYIGQKKLDPNRAAAEASPHRTERGIFLPNALDAQVKIEELVDQYVARVEGGGLPVAMACLGPQGPGTGGTLYRKRVGNLQFRGNCLGRRGRIHEQGVSLDSFSDRGANWETYHDGVTWARALPASF